MPLFCTLHITFTYAYVYQMPKYFLPLYIVLLIMILPMHPCIENERNVPESLRIQEICVAFVSNNCGFCCDQCHWKYTLPLLVPGSVLRFGGCVYCKVDAVLRAYIVTGCVTASSGARGI
jgi:hypothetical protein